MALVAVAVVGASLQRLVDSPARWGTTWDVAVHAAVFAPDDAQQEVDGVAEPDREVLLNDAEMEAAAVALYDEEPTSTASAPSR